MRSSDAASGKASPRCRRCSAAAPVRAASSSATDSSPRSFRARPIRPRSTPPWRSTRSKAPDALEELEVVYGDAGVRRWAVWIDGAARDVTTEFRNRGLAIASASPGHGRRDRRARDRPDDRQRPPERQPEHGRARQRSRLRQRRLPAGTNADHAHGGRPARLPRRPQRRARRGRARAAPRRGLRRLVRGDRPAGATARPRDPGHALRARRRPPARPDDDHAPGHGARRAPVPAARPADGSARWSCGSTAGEPEPGAGGPALLPALREAADDHVPAQHHLPALRIRRLLQPEAGRVRDPTDRRTTTSS